MKVCWHCGNGFDGVLRSGKAAAHCDECQQIPITDGSTESYRLSYLMSDLQNRDWLEEEYQLIADSSLGPDLVGEIIDRMDRKCLANLLRKHSNAIMEARDLL